MSSVSNGKAFEYAIAKALKNHTKLEIDENNALQNAKSSFDSLEHSLKANMKISASNAIKFLIKVDQGINFGEKIQLQGDDAGKRGDVRDIVIPHHEGEFGISAKHNHDAVKHSRLGKKIDFGERWGGHPVSDEYWSAIESTFNKMEEEKGKKYSEFHSKEDLFYLPILIAFEDELKRLCEYNQENFVIPLFKYLVGIHDFYKVICWPSYTSIEPYNINGSLKWGSNWKLPKRIDRIQRPLGKKNTLIINFEGGWQFSFRIHSASSKIESSLKFDIKFDSTPQKYKGMIIPHS